MIDFEIFANLRVILLCVCIMLSCTPQARLPRGVHQGGPVPALDTPEHVEHASTTAISTNTYLQLHNVIMSSYYLDKAQVFIHCVQHLSTVFCFPERACSIKTTQHHGPECDEDEEEDEQDSRQNRVSSSAHAVFL